MRAVREPALPIPADVLAAFVVDAHRHGYAAQGDSATTLPLLPGSRQLDYGSGAFRSRDIYFGSRSFVGQETVYYQGEAVWAISYAGRIIPPDMPAARVSHIYTFLRAALRAVTAQAPYRGPSSFRQGDLWYVNEVHGEMEAFWGTERISEGGTEVYLLRYAGGAIR